MTNSQPRTLFGSGAALVVAAAIVAFTLASLYPGLFRTDIKTAPEGSSFDSSLQTLSSSNSARERMQAARWLGDSTATASSHLIQSLSQSLVSDPDPAVRAQVARSFGEIARRRNSDSAAPAEREPQMIEALSAAYDSESNPSVRRSIVVAAGNFNHAMAADVLDKASLDPDPAVREAAIEARLARQRRLLSAMTG